jgi:hypothetical protein
MVDQYEFYKKETIDQLHQHYSQLQKDIINCEADNLKLSNIHKKSREDIVYNERQMQQLKKENIFLNEKNYELIEDNERLRELSDRDTKINEIKSLRRENNQLLEQLRKLDHQNYQLMVRNDQLVTENAQLLIDINPPTPQNSISNFTRLRNLFSRN